ncbi:MAG TPA: sigma-70 family RNA polymerase sigma factor [Gaiellaceae bacterium]|jgi:RNA polymerase sigma-70 factor, ECF subfamily|nr:sigma-70 family RNA polymerase sigma factor [Gaiellaceae bacterium]
MGLARRGASIADIEAVYRRRLTDFRRVATAIVGEREAALDVVQDAFATAVRDRRDFRREGPLEAWLWRAVVNAARTASRRRDSYVLNAAPQIDARATENGGAPDELTSSVRAALAALPERQRLTLFLRYYGDLDYDAIARLLDVRPGTVGATLTAARHRLEHLIEKEVSA